MSTPTLLASAAKICNHSNEVVVYGFNNCKYVEIKDYLKELSIKCASPFKVFFKKVLTCKVGKPYSKTSTLKGDISKIEYEGSYSIPRTCKSGLVNIVMENYKRELRGEEIIPILFCIDVSNNATKTPLTPESLASKKEDYNCLITFKELRRAYKLCEEIDDEEIRDVARRSFKFVKVNVPSGEEARVKFESGYVQDAELELTTPPWEDPKWKKAWEKRKESSKSTVKKLDWKDQAKKIKSSSQPIHPIRPSSPSDNFLDSFFPTSKPSYKPGSLSFAAAFESPETYDLPPPDIFGTSSSKTTSLDDGPETFDEMPSDAFTITPSSKVTSTTTS